MMHEEEAFLLRDVPERLQQWRGTVVDVHVWEPEVGWSFVAFRATVGPLDFDADLDGSGGRLEVHFDEEGHLLVLYADLVESLHIDERSLEIEYRGGKTEIALT